MKILLTVLIVVALLFIKTLLKLKVIRRRVAREIDQTSVDKIAQPGFVSSFTLFPLIDFFSDDSRYKTEAGVSYMISADERSTSNLQVLRGTWQRYG